jgi:hypothetical protein
MWLGGYDESYITSGYTAAELADKTVDDLIAWMPVTSNSYWQVQLSQV